LPHNKNTNHHIPAPAQETDTQMTAETKTPTEIPKIVTQTPTQYITEEVVILDLILVEIVTLDLILVEAVTLDLILVEAVTLDLILVVVVILGLILVPLLVGVILLGRLEDIMLMRMLVSL